MKNTLFYLFLLGIVPSSLAQTIFEDNFNNNVFKSPWSLKSNLSGSDGLIELNSLADVRNAGFGVLMGKSADGALTKNALDLRLDLQGKSQVELTFWIEDISDETQQDDGIWFSNNGGATFKQVFKFQPGDWYKTQFLDQCMGRRDTHSGRHLVLQQWRVEFHQSP